MYSTDNNLTLNENTITEHLEQKIHIGLNPICTLARASSFQSVLPNAENNVLWDKTLIDNSGISDITNNNIQITVNTDGKYLVSATVPFEIDSSGYRQVSFKLFRSGTQNLIGISTQQPVSGEFPILNVSTIVDCLAGDLLSVTVTHTANNAINLAYSFSYSKFTVVRVG